MTRPSSTPAAVTRRLLQTLFGEHPGAFRVRLWDGTYWPDEAPREATLLLNHPGAMRAAFLPGTEVAVGEAYLHDDFDVEANLEAFYGAAERLLRDTSSWIQKMRVVRQLRRLPAESRRAVVLKQRAGNVRGRARVSGRRHSVERDRQAVAYHYDVSNDFFRLWQDPGLVYSCAYFHAVDEDLDAAQERKLDYLCRKLGLQRGQRLLDVGCGWGSLVMHAARVYGVDATGITLGQPQVDLANERIHQEGLDGRCRVAVRDYREMQEESAYDALVSVGMFEHVGAARLPEYFARAWDLLKPGGVFLNHGIAMRGSDKRGSVRGFGDTYVFPDGELVPIHVTLRAAEKAGFEVRDVESLREHYAMTLRHWVRRLEAHHDEALRYVDEPTYRVWRLFMSASAHRFATGQMNLYQALLVKPDLAGSSHLPLTRGDWYR